MADIEETIAERRKSHGDYADVSSTYTALLWALRLSSGFNRLNSAQWMSAEMILHKLARAANGDPNFEDHWYDIEGYAALARKACKKSSS